jgi:hypothetical protein
VRACQALPVSRDTSGDVRMRDTQVLEYSQNVILDRTFRFCHHPLTSYGHRTPLVALPDSIKRASRDTCDSEVRWRSSGVPARSS